MRSRYCVIHYYIPLITRRAPSITHYKYIYVCPCMLYHASMEPYARCVAKLLSTGISAAATDRRKILMIDFSQHQFGFRTHHYVHRRGGILFFSMCSSRCVFLTSRCFKIVSQTYIILHETLFAIARIPCVRLFYAFFSPIAIFCYNTLK